MEPTGKTMKPHQQSTRDFGVIVRERFTVGKTCMLPNANTALLMANSEALSRVGSNYNITEPMLPRRWR